MPIYEYQCTACEYELEALQKMSDDALIHCPECNEASLKKKISAAAFQLKGTGWYETDFKNSGAKSEQAAATKADTPTAKPKKAESKPKVNKSGAKSSRAA